MGAVQVVAAAMIDADRLRLALGKGTFELAKQYLASIARAGIAHHVHYSHGSAVPLLLSIALRPEQLLKGEGRGDWWDQQLVGSTQHVGHSVMTPSAVWQKQLGDRHGGQRTLLAESACQQFSPPTWLDARNEAASASSAASRICSCCVDSSAWLRSVASLEARISAACTAGGTK